ncbi:unnamed protein product, partial [Candidula unifasciata]
MEAAEEPEILEASLRDSENKPIPIRLMLYTDALLVQKQEWISVQLDEEDEVFLNMVRDVNITREPGAGFGLCVKGGAEHRLPVLISRIVKNEASDRCGQLLVGDAILRTTQPPFKKKIYELKLPKMICCFLLSLCIHQCCYLFFY